MKINQQAKQMATNLGLSQADALIMELKSELYLQASKAIKNSKDSYEEMAKKIGISKTQIHKIGGLGANNLSIELLVKIIVILENKIPFRLIA